MRSMIRRTLGLAALVLVLSAHAAMATTPTVNDVILIPRVWNDCPTSNLEGYDFFDVFWDVWFDDDQVDCGGYANLHVWRYSGDGVTAAIFPNASDFSSSADLVISGVTEAEAGLQIRPWWSEADGRFNVRSTDGEIACFGGRLPFFSFTGTYGLHYVKGTPIHLEVIYHQNGLSMANPGTIEYLLVYNSVSYSSGALPFDEGNGAEGHGTWGILDGAQVGGYVQVFLAAGNPDAQARADWTNAAFQDLTPPVPVERTSWGRIKAGYRN